MPLCINISPLFTIARGREREGRRGEKKKKEKKRQIEAETSEMK
jgi:hypothetical protein